MGQIYTHQTASLTLVHHEGPFSTANSLQAYLSIYKVSRPAEARHHSCDPIRVSEHEANCHLVKPGPQTEAAMRQGKRSSVIRQTGKGASKRQRHHPERSNPLPGIPEGQNGSSSSPVASLVVVVIHKDQGSVRGDEAPAFSPVPSHKHRDLRLPCQLLGSAYARLGARSPPLL